MSGKTRKRDPGVDLKEIKPARLVNHAGKGIAVFDDIFTEDFVCDFSIYIAKQNYELRPSKDNELSCPLSREEIESLPVFYRVIDHVAERFYPAISDSRKPQSISHGYFAAFRFGDSAEIHKDIPCDDCLTFLYYGNIQWSGAWGGETVFYDDDGDSIACVTPKPGRLVMFNGGLYHRAGIQTKSCPTFRYGLSVFYRCKKFQPKRLKK